MQPFAGQVAVITGASSGIGHALAREFARQGAAVGLLARREDRLSDLVQQIERAGGRAVAVRADVGNREELRGAVAHVAEWLGPVDVLVANAGVGVPSPADPVNVEDIERMTRVNFLGVVHAFAAVLPDMVRRGRGHLVAVSSLAALRGLPGHSAYAASKAAVNTYLEGLRLQVREQGVAVTTVLPGFVRSEMTASHQFHMPWLLDADEAARRIVRALRRRPAVFAFPWQTLWLMRLVRWLPDGFVLRRLHAAEPGGTTPPLATDEPAE